LRNTQRWRALGYQRRLLRRAGYLRALSASWLVGVCLTGTIMPYRSDNIGQIRQTLGHGCVTKELLIYRTLVLNQRNRCAATHYARSRKLLSRNTFPHYAIARSRSENPHYAAPQTRCAATHYVESRVGAKYVALQGFLTLRGRLNSRCGTTTMGALLKSLSATLFWRIIHK
jgi:hypothetical protein